MTRAYVALGANLGDRLSSLRAAVAALQQYGRVTAVSSVWETAPVGAPPPAYLNAAVALDTELPPRALLEALLAVEKSAGRVRTSPNAPRTLDLDLLLYGDAIVSDNELVVPHPRLHERRFVLEPLAEIAGEVVHPVLRCSIAALRDRARAQAQDAHRLDETLV